MKVFVLAPQEDWICDRLAVEWYENFSHLSTRNIYEADIIWLLAGWCWQHVPLDLLKTKKIIVTEHHIVPEKFTQQKYKNFLMRDQFVDCYHAPNETTRTFLKKITNKNIALISYWWNDKFWNKIDKVAARNELKINMNDFCIGSFQRDTEGSDLQTPKLEKGPDLLCDYIERVYKDEPNLHIILGGWRRQYVMSRLKKHAIKYTLFEKVDLETIKKLYACCDLYIVSSRYEGGPQSIIEAAAMETPIISTDVGIASNILSSNCILDIKTQHYVPTIQDIQICKNNLNRIKIKDIGNLFIKLFESIL